MAIWQMSLWASVIILAVIILRTAAFYRIPKYTLLLWSPAVVRLLIPFRFRIMLPYGVSEIPVLYAGTAINALSTDLLGVETMSASGLSAVSVIKFLWAVVGIGLLMYFICSHVYRCRIYKLAVPVKNKYVNEWQQDNRLKWRTVKVKVSKDISSPFSYSVFSPVILMPGNTEWENREQLKCILTHEMVHIRRFDTLWKYVLMFALCIHWFNPFVWVMYVLVNRDMEITCDEKVIHILGDCSRTAYALTLLNLAEKQAAFISFGNFFSKNAMEERIVIMMKSGKKTVYSAAVTVIAMLALVGFTACTAVTNTEQLESVSSDTFMSSEIREEVDASGITYAVGTDNAVGMGNAAGMDTVVNESDEVIVDSVYYYVYGEMRGSKPMIILEEYICTGEELMGNKKINMESMTYTSTVTSTYTYTGNKKK